MTDYRLITEPEFQGYRLDDFLLIKIKTETRTGIRKAAGNGLLLVNNIPVKPGFKLNSGDLISAAFVKADKIIPENLNLEIVYEDPNLVVINKPAGMVVHPSVSHYSGTLLNGLYYHFQKQGIPKPLLLHRLDKDTSGLIAAAKDNITHRSMSKQFKNHTAKRTYLALVLGNCAEEKFTIAAKIAETSRKNKEMKIDEHGKEAVTHFRVIKRFGLVTLLSCNLETGRTHQVRLHLKYAGYPILNDPVYTPDKNTAKLLKEVALLLPGQALHACELEFFHPFKNIRIKLKAELPAGFREIINCIE